MNLSNRAILARLWRLFGPYRDWMLAGFGLSLVTLIANVTLMATAGWFIASMAVAGASGIAMNYYLPATLIRATAILRTVGRYGERLVTHAATFRLIAKLRVWFYNRLEPLAPARLQQIHSGDVLSRIRSDIDALDNLYTRTLVPLLVAASSLLLFFIFLLNYDWRIALLCITFLLLAGVLIPFWSGRVGRVPGRRVTEVRSSLRVAAIDGIQGLSELLVYGAYRAHADHLDALSRELVAEQDRMRRQAGTAQAATGLMGNLSLWGLLWLAIPMVEEKSLPPADLAMLALFTLASFEAVGPLPNAFHQLAGTLASARRLFEIADAAPAVSEPAGLSPRPSRYDLELIGVGFAYPGAERPALDGVSITLREGQRLGIVGATGSGKSTLFNLLLKFWQPSSGVIRLDGKDLAEYHGEDVRAAMAVVSQRTHLFDATIRDNLLLAAPDASQGAIEAACETAQIHEFIAGLPDGYNTWVGETGVRLSAGQARRIAIARALLKDAPILLLDEPTEGLDGPTERSLIGAIERLMRGRSVLLITHRPIGLEAMDEIVLLDQGRIIDRGDYRSLTAGEYFPRLMQFDERRVS